MRMSGLCKVEMSALMGGREAQWKWTDFSSLDSLKSATQLLEKNWLGRCIGGIVKIA